MGYGMRNSSKMADGLFVNVKVNVKEDGKAKSGKRKKVWRQ